MLRAQRGDAEAIEELYRVNQPLIFRYVYFRVRDRETAEDLTGEVFVQMVTALPRYEDRGVPIAAWLFRIAHDRVVDHHRRAAHQPTEPVSDALEDDRPSTEAAAFDRLDSRQLRRMMDSLTDEQRLVIQLRFVEGYDLEDCARLMQKTTGAIKSLQHRALQQLARKLTP